VWIHSLSTFATSYLKERNRSTISKKIRIFFNMDTLSLLHGKKSDILTQTHTHTPTQTGRKTQAHNWHKVTKQNIVYIQSFTYIQCLSVSTSQTLLSLSLIDGFIMAFISVRRGCLPLPAKMPPLLPLTRTHDLPAAQESGGLTITPRHLTVLIYILHYIHYIQLLY
jgi:hypothetical protein